MKSTRILKSALPLALAGLLLASGCHKQNQQPNNSEPSSASQNTAPPPPPDQSGSTQASSSSASQPASPSASSGTSAAPAPPPPLVIPAGFHIAITVQQALGSKISQDGETFAGTLAAPLTANGVTAIPAGSPVTGTVIAAHALGRFKGGALLELRLDSVRSNGMTYQIASSTLERADKGKGKRTTVLAGGGAGLGALIGGLAGGGKGALIGALAGGGAGTAGSAFTGNKEIVIPAESTLTFRLEHSITVQQ